jgi:uncharacterized protein (DUF58 family)
MALAPAAFLDPALLARISDLELLARTVVDGFMAGVHRSARKGASLDFAEHRAYQPGDDLRRVDWRLFARTDRYYVKEYEADTNVSVWLALDTSASMDYTTHAVTKFDYARFLVAALAWLSKGQGDRVGFVGMADDLGEVIPPSARHLQRILHALARTPASGRGRLLETLDRVAHVTTRAGVVVVVSDCYEPADRLGRAVDTLRARGHDVIVFHPVDPGERELPFAQPLTIEDAESGLRLPLRPDELRRPYREAFAAHRQALADRLVAARADYVALDTSEPLDRALRAYLDRRALRHPGR